MPYTDPEVARAYYRKVYAKRMQDPVYRLYSSMRKKIWRKERPTYKRWLETYYPKIRDKSLAYAKDYRKNLKDGYVRACLKEDFLPPKKIPKALIDLKRMQLRLKLEIKKHENIK